MNTGGNATGATVVVIGRKWACLALVALLGACGGDGGDPADPPPPPPVNAAPTANAGADQVVEAGASVSLAGSGSDSDGTIASHAWTQTGGALVTLGGANSATASFVAPATAGTLTFQLTVTDNGGATHSDSVVVTVTASAPPPPPTVAPVIGRQPLSPNAFEHGSALLFVAASGEDLTYEWRRSPGAVVKSGPEPFLLLGSVNSSDDGDCYRVVVANAAGSVTSEAGCVTVWPLEMDLDPFDDEGAGGEDDEVYASNFGNTLMSIAQLVAGPLTGPSLAAYPGITGVVSGVPAGLQSGFSCHSGEYLGATLDGVSVATAALVPIGSHTISVAWDQCRETSDDGEASTGGMLVEYDFPVRLGEGTITFYLSGYGYNLTVVNGILRATITAHADTGRDEIAITVEEDFSSAGLKVTSTFPQTISIRRDYSNDGMLMDDTRIDFDVLMTAYDAEGIAGTIFQDAAGDIRLQQNQSGGDSGQPTHVSTGEFSVGLSGGFHLARLRAVHGNLGWVFAVQPPEECPGERDNEVCIDLP